MCLRNNCQPRLADVNPGCSHFGGRGFGQGPWTRLEPRQERQAFLRKRGNIRVLVRTGATRSTATKAATTSTTSTATPVIKMQTVEGRHWNRSSATVNGKIAKHQTSRQARQGARLQRMLQGRLTGGRKTNSLSMFICKSYAGRLT